MRFSWEGVLSHTWISPWDSENGLLCEEDHQKEICHICTYAWRNQCISEYMFDYGFLHSDILKIGKWKVKTRRQCILDSFVKVLISCERYM